MTKTLLALHVLAAIVAIGPIAVAASMFPGALRRAVDTGTTDDRATAIVLHRICRVYAWIGIAVPIVGIGTAHSMGVFGSSWLIMSTTLTLGAALVLALLVLPRQSKLLTGSDSISTRPALLDTRATKLLALHTGTFNLLWAIVTVLMIVRPGSTTGG
ncbi:DUF2269 family protein [Nocardia tengchongensis]|uniref:DUF2269 family protein n=1 Tax=Nocardia tengchongensis TaxID=2055889 RepID=UPI003683DE49